MTPWNTPLFTVAQKNDLILAAGNTLVLKPSEWNICETPSPARAGQKVAGTRNDPVGGILPVMVHEVPAPHQLSLSSTLRDQALAYIRQGMVTGDFAPDEIYSSATVAAHLGVSNSPVREAMLTLVNEGYMEPVRNRGFRVVQLSDKDRRDIYELRLMLEPPAMAKAAASPGPGKAQSAELKALAKRTVDCAKSGDLVGHLESDRKFHLDLTALAGNEQLTKTVMRLRDQTRRYSLRSMPPEVLTANAEEHFPILDAVVYGRAEEAQELMVRHLDHLAGDAHSHLALPGLKDAVSANR